MPGLSVKTAPLVSRSKASPAGIGAAADAVAASSLPFAKQLAEALKNQQSINDQVFSIFRNTSPNVQEIKVTDNTGKVVAFLGDFEFNGVITRNYFSEIHIGDPLGTGDPTQAVLNMTPDGKLTLGGTGWMDVLDPFGADAAWIGTQFDTLAVTGAIDNGSGLIRLTVVGHSLVTGDSVIVMDVGGVPNATGTFTVTVISASLIDLQLSVFTGTYTSGGTVTNLLHVSGAANNGTGLIRITTATAHNYESSNKVSILAVGGVPNATGQWLITVIDATHFDLVGSTFAGAFTSGGTVIRYFAGGLFQTIAIGPSFQDYRLQAFPDGTLRIRNASISVTNVASGITVTIDPQFGGVKVSTSTQSSLLEDSSLVFAFAGNSAGAIYYNQGFGFSDSIGTSRFVYGIGTGLTLLDAGGSEIAQWDTTGNSDAKSYSVNGTPGRTVTRAFGTSLSVTTGSALTGTPGPGQSTTSVVTGVTLTTISNVFSGGLLI